MKRKTLTNALLAGVAGVAGIANISNAVNLNPDGLGEVLIYPFYTVNGGNDTLLSVVNTTDSVKAVKVRFVESKNSREVLDFNLYLSPYDVWTGAVIDPDGDDAGPAAVVTTKQKEIRVYRFVPTEQEKDKMGQAEKAKDQGKRPRLNTDLPNPTMELIRLDEENPK